MIVFPPEKEYHYLGFSIVQRRSQVIWKRSYKEVSHSVSIFLVRWLILEDLMWKFALVISGKKVLILLTPSVTIATSDFQVTEQFMLLF